MQKQKEKILKKLEKAKEEHLKIHTKDMTTEIIDAYIETIKECSNEDELKLAIEEAKEYLGI